MPNKRTTNGFVAYFSFYTDLAKKIFLLFFFFIYSDFAKAELHASDFNISAYTKKSAPQYFDDIQEVIRSDAFVPLKDYDNHGIESSWLKIQWNKNKVNNEQFFMNNGLSTSYSENYFLIKDNKVIANYSTGIDEPFSTRPIDHFKFVFDIENADYVLAKICCNSKSSNFFRLLSEDELLDDYFYKIIKYAILYSLIAVFVIYNFFIWTYLRDKKYLWYCCYLGSVLTGLLSFSGIGKQFFWPESSNLHFYYYNYGPIFTILGALFITSFLNKQYITRRTYQVLLITIGLQITAAIVSLVAFLGFRENIPIFLNQYLVVVQTLTRIGLLVNVYIITRSFFAGDKTANLLLFGYGLVNIGVIIAILRNVYTMPDSSWSEFVIEIAMVIEAVLLSLAMAQNIQELKNQKLATEKKKLKLQENFSWQLIEIQEYEKRQIGKVLQDDFSHQLLILKNSIMKKIGVGEETTKTEKIINEIRDLSSLYHPHILENLGLKESLIALIAQTEKKRLIDINFAYNDCNLSQQQSLIVFRIIQEALENIIKHAKGASECLICVDCGQENISVMIKDDGEGFDLKNNHGLGVKIMKERCKRLLGDFDIKSSEFGTSITITFPINDSKENIPLTT